MGVLLNTVVMASYILVGSLLAVGYRRGIRADRDYYVAGYGLSGLLSALTYAATTYSAFMIVGLVGFTYATGVGALGFELSYFVATLFLLTLFAPRVWRMARERGWISPGEMLADLYGSRRLALAASLIYLYALVPYMAAQVKGIAEAVKAAVGGGMGYSLGVAVGLGLMAFWTIIAGVWSVAVTDAMQGLWMIASSLLLLGWLLAHVSASMGLEEASRVLEAKGLLGITGFWKPHVFLGFTIPWVFFAVTNPQVVQRLYMPRDERALKTMVKWFAVFGISYTVIVTMIGLFTRSLSELGELPLIHEKDAVTPTLLGQAPSLLAAMVFTSIVAAAVSTADSIALSVASSVVRDLLAGRPAAGSLAVGRAVTFALILAAGALSYARVGFIVALSVLSSYILLSLAPPTILAWISPGRARESGGRAVVSVIVSAALLTAIALAYGVKALTATFMKLPVSAWILIVSTLILLAPNPSGRR